MSLAPGESPWSKSENHHRLPAARHYLLSVSNRAAGSPLKGRAMSEIEWKQRCTAHRKNGERCGRWANRGMTVCNSHGGRAPQARRKAQQRLEEASDIAVKRIVAIMNDSRISPAVRLAAAKDILDRADVRGTERISIEMPEWEQRMQKVFVVDYDDDSIDAEVVEDEQQRSLPATRRNDP